MGFLDNIFGGLGLLGVPPQQQQQGGLPPRQTDPGLFGLGRVDKTSIYNNARSDEKRSEQAVYDAFIKAGLPPQTAAAAALSPTFPAALESLTHGKTTDDIREYEYAKRQGFQGGFTEWQLKKKSGQGEYGLNPIYGVGADGKPAIMQLGRAGVPIIAQTPEGFTIQNKPLEFDMGTHTLLLDPQTRQVLGQIPKNLEEKAKQTQVGKDTGTAIGELASIESKLPGLESVVTKLEGLSDKATYTTAGKLYDSARRQINAEPREEAVARVEYEAIVKNQIFPLLRDTFGAQFTQKEGEDLRTTLGDPDKSPKEKQAVLRAFIEQKRRDVGALRTRTGTAGTDSLMAEARAAIAKGAPRDKVIERLRQMNIDPSGL